MSNDHTRNVFSRRSPITSGVAVRPTRTSGSPPDLQRVHSEATTDDDMPSLHALLDDSDNEDDTARASIYTLPAPSMERGRPPSTGSQQDLEDGQARPPPPSASSSSPSSLLSPETRPPDDASSDAESEESLPSLQTVSDSSDEDWTDEESDEDESEEDESEEDESEEDEGEEDEERPEDDSALDSLPQVGPANLPPGAARLMQTPTGAVAEARDGWVGVDFEGEDEEDPSDPVSILASPGSNPIRRLLSPQAEDLRSPNIVLDAMRQVLDTLGRGPAIPETDPKRAEMILKTLETVPEELVRRYEKLRAGQDGEENEGCAVCRESFLDPTNEEATVAVQFAELPYPQGEGSKSVEALSSTLVFPCPGMHLFHSRCISPWLGRKTTCPTCRFDIDPDSLTLTFLREIRQRTNHPLADKPWTLRRRGFKRWLEREERKLEGGSDGHKSGFESEEFEEIVYGSEDEDSDDLPPLIADQLATTNSVPAPIRNNTGFSQTAPRNTPPYGRLPPDIVGFYNIDPVTRENMLAALLPIMGMAMDGSTGGFAPPLDEESGDEWEDDEDDDELPALIPSTRGALRESTRPYLPASDDTDDELPALVNAQTSSSRSRTAHSA